MKKIMVALIACCAAAWLHAADLNWLTDLPKAEALAKDQNKLVLMDFTGSDWCPWCQKMDKDTLTQPQFADYAQKNLVLVLVDFPNSKPQSDALKAANKALAEKYGVNGYPTLIAVKPDGSVVMTQVGYLEGGPQALIDQIDAAKKK
ncbi:MAG TPA: thioredoxin fold domain-containing protein [Verrucomicrobiae bacterium]|nr:thioredoxin fold domain-containing protein [Verrucomicrobiae bacterium]